MIAREFLQAVGKGEGDVLQILLDVLSDSGSNYCVIGGLAVNAYVDPVVSLDLDIVIAADRLAEVTDAAAARGFRVDPFEHSINLSLPGSDLRIQLQTDPRYQDFIEQSEMREILGYTLKTASLLDVLRGKTWAYLDQSRRGSKRQKDLADIARLVESFPDLMKSLPEPIRERL